jgi:DNA repair exonuclease SbcCD ATPase subunit
LKEKEKNENEIALLAEELRKLEKESRSVCNEIDSLKEKKAVLKGLQKFSCGIAQQEKEIFLLKEETKKAEKAVAELGFDEKALRKLQDQKTNAVARQRELRVQLESAKEIEKQLAERIGEFKAIEKQLLDLEQKAIALESTGEKLSLFTNCLKETQAELRETLIDATNQAMQDIWERIYPYKDYSSARIFVDEKGDYELVVLDKSGNWTKVEGILSGGERSAAAICIRIAFSLVLAQNLSMLILDEPTHNLDSQAITVLSEMMKSHLPNLVEQIFVITHDKQMEKAASASLYLLERDKDNDGITIPVLKETE